MIKANRDKARKVYLGEAARYELEKPPAPVSILLSFFVVFNAPKHHDWPKFIIALNAKTD